MRSFDDTWNSMKTAPKDGTVILLKHHHDKMPCFYSAWWMPGEKYDTQDGVEYDGHNWVLNDDDHQLIEEDEDLEKWSWRAI